MRAPPPTIGDDDDDDEEEEEEEEEDGPFARVLPAGSKKQQRMPKRASQGGRVQRSDAEVVLAGSGSQQQQAAGAQGQGQNERRVHGGGERRHALSPRCSLH
jgi:hypothetical protein